MRRLLSLATRESFLGALLTRGTGVGRRLSLMVRDLFLNALLTDMKGQDNWRGSGRAKRSCRCHAEFAEAVGQAVAIIENAGQNAQ